MSSPFDAFLSRCISDCVNANHEPACAEPHQGCGCERDASQGAHEGPCEYEGGYGDGSQVVCIHCAEVIRESKHGR